MIEPIDLGIAGLTNIERIGAGGNAIVYRARQRDLDRDVVVKVLTNLDAETTGRRFDRERRAMGRLSQAGGIAPLYGTGFTSSGRPYLLMPFYELGSLQHWLESKGSLPVDQVRKIGVTVARAVQTAHENGVLHRDLKPANILMSRSGNPDVADFGIAHLVDDALGTSQALTMTPLYTAPEVFDGIESGAAGDVYSLGATLYALLDGRPAFGDPTGSTPVLSLMRRINEDPWPPLRSEVPAELSAVIEKAMSKDPANRHVSAGQLATALAAANIEPVIEPTRAPRQAKSRVLAAAGIAVLVAAAIGALVAFTMLRNDGETVTQPEPTSAAVTNTSSAATPEPTSAAGTPRSFVEFDAVAAAAAGSQAVVRVEAYSCAGVEVAQGIILNDGLIVTSADALASPWYIDVTIDGEAFRATAQTADEALGLGLVVLDDPSSVAVLPGVVVQPGDHVGLVGIDGRPAEARILEADIGSGTAQAELINPRAGNAIEPGDAAVTDSGGLVGVVLVNEGAIEVLTPQEMEVEWSPSPPNYGCRIRVGDLGPEQAESAVSPAIRELLTLQRLSKSYADEDWTDVRAMEPAKSSFSDESFIAGWRPLREGFIYPVERMVDIDGLSTWRIALIGHETWASTDLTTLFCVNWSVDPVSGEVTQGSEETVTTVFGSQPGQPQRTGFVDPADLRDLISQNC